MHTVIRRELTPSKGLFTADGKEIEASPGDLLVVGPETPHKFKTLGTGRLDVVCIHAAPG
jgi:mannose-6-phosphate isomerase-like protein (cupin superfamily)